MSEQTSTKKQDDPVIEYMIKRLAYAYGFRGSQEYAKFHETACGET